MESNWARLDASSQLLAMAVSIVVGAALVAMVKVGLELIETFSRLMAPARPARSHPVQRALQSILDLRA